MTELLTTAQKLIESGELKPDGISYKENQVLITTSSCEKSFRFDVEKPRLAFAMVLALFEEPRMQRTRGLEHVWLSEKSNLPLLVGDNVVIGGAGFGYERDEDGIPFRIKSLGNVVIGKNVEIGSNTCIDRGTTGSTIIGDYVKIDNLCHFGHNVVIGKCNTFAANCSIEGSVMIGDFNTFGTSVVVLRKVKIGSHCIIGSGSVVTKDVDDYSVMAGNPARLLRRNM